MPAMLIRSMPLMAARRQPDCFTALIPQRWSLLDRKNGSQYQD